MQQLFFESLILIIAILGILLTIFQMFFYRTEKKLYYKIIKLKNDEGNTIDIIVSANDYDNELENAIKEAFSTYHIDSE